MADYIPPRSQDAFATIRGFVYQVDLTILRWLELQGGQVLELERGEDIDRIVQTANSDDPAAERLLEQVKRREQSVTLRTAAALEAIANALEQRKKNPGLAVVFRYATNSPIGQEHHTTVPDKTPLLDLWRRVQRDQCDNKRTSEIAGHLRRFVGQVPRPQQIHQDRWNSLQHFFRDADEAEFVAFLRTFEWSTGLPEAEELAATVRGKLQIDGHAHDKQEAQQQYERLFLHVFRVLSKPGLKQLTVDDLHTVLRAPVLSVTERAEIERVARGLQRLGLRVCSLEKSLGDVGQELKNLATKRDMASVHEKLDGINEQLRSRYSEISSTAPERASEEPAAASAAGRVSAPVQPSQLKVLAARVGILEESERKLLDHRGQQLWQDAQRSMRDLDLRTAVSAGSQLAAWLDEEGRSASASVRGRAAVLLADLAIVDLSQRLGDDRVDTVGARRWHARALHEFGHEPTAEDSAKLVALDAKLRFLEGAADDALKILEGEDDPACLTIRLSIYLERSDWDSAVHLVDRRPLHERWCDRAILAYIASGQVDEARIVLDWARTHSDTTTFARCVLAFAQESLRRLFGAKTPAECSIPGAFHGEDGKRLAEVLALVQPLFAVAETRRRASNGVETEALGLAVVAARLLSHVAECDRYSALLGTAEPVPLEFARAALRGDVATPNDLPLRLRRDHSELLEAHCLAALLEADRLSNRDAALPHLLGQTALAITARQREHVCTTMLEIAVPAGPSATARVEAAAVALLGPTHSLVTFVRAIHALQSEQMETAATLVEACRSDHDPLWLQLSASLKLSQGNGAAAFDDLLKAARLLPREEVLERTALLGIKLREDERAADVLKTLVSVAPQLRRGLELLASVSARLGRHADAAEYCSRLWRAAPDVVTYGVNAARALALAGRKEESLRAFDEVCQRHPNHLPALGSRSLLLEAMGRPDQAFQSLQSARQQFWSDPNFLLLYLSLGYKANCEEEAHTALGRLIELQNQGHEVPLKSFSVEQMQVFFRERREQHEELNRNLLGGRVPWMLVGRLLGRVPYADWAMRTHELIVPDDPHNHAEFTVYASDGWTVRPNASGERELEQIRECPAPGQTIVADLSALITLHRLGMLGLAADYFGRIIIPAGYARLAIEDQANLQPRQPSIVDALRQICDAIDAKKITLPPHTGSGALNAPALLDEFEDEKVAYRLTDIVSWLQRSGRITEGQMASFERTTHKAAAAGLPPVNQVVLSGFITTVATLQTAALSGLLPVLLRVVRLHLPQEEIDALRSALQAARFKEEIAGWNRELWDFLLIDGRFEKLDPSADTSSQTEDEEDPEELRGMLLAAPLLATQRGLPLLVDDRAFQRLQLQTRDAEPAAAFGTDGLLNALAAADRLTPDELADSFLQLIHWRYRFLVPPVAVLLTLAARQPQFPPSEALREISRYVHDSMRDPALPAAPEPVKPPVSVAWKSYQHWVYHVASFLAHVWHDRRFDDASAKAITRWAVAELLPTPPRSLPWLGIIIGSSTVAEALIGSVIDELWQFRDPDRSNIAIRTIAEALGFSEDAYLDVVATVLETYRALESNTDHAGAALRVQRLVAYMTASHVTNFNARSFASLKRIGALRDTSPQLTEGQIAAIAEPNHRDRDPTLPGPLVFLRAPTDRTKGCALSVPNLLFDRNPAVRRAALQYFGSAPTVSGTWLCPRSRAAIAEYAAALQSDNEAEWSPAAHRLSEILGEDFLLQLAGFAQAGQTGLREEQNEAWHKVLRPDLFLLSSVPHEWYGLPDAGTSTSTVPPSLDGAESLDGVLNRYWRRFGHLMLAPPHSAGTAVRRWVESGGPSNTVWEGVWLWASSVSSPLAHYHACQVFLQCPDLIPGGKQAELWEQCRPLFLVGRNDADPAEPFAVAWRFRSQLARHYLGLLELLTADQHPDRLAALAWWSAERVAEVATQSIASEGLDAPTMAERQRQVVDENVQMQADFTASIGSLFRPNTSPSSFALATRDIRGLPAISLLSAGAAADSSAVTPYAEGAEADIALTLYAACLSGFPAQGSQGTAPVLAFDAPFNVTAEYWLQRIQQAEIRKASHEALELQRSLGDPIAWGEAIRNLMQATQTEQLMTCHSFRVACALGTADSGKIWELLSDQNWTRDVFSKLDLPSLQVLCFGLLEIQRREGARWHWALPDYFASIAEQVEMAFDRRKIIAVLTLRSCATGGTIAAIRRLLSSPRSVDLQPFLSEWRPQLEEMQRCGPAVVAAFLRNILANLPPRATGIEKNAAESGVDRPES